MYLHTHVCAHSDTDKINLKNAYYNRLGGREEEGIYIYIQVKIRSKMAQEVEVLVNKSDDLSSLPGTHMVKGEQTP